MQLMRWEVGWMVGWLFGWLVHLPGWMGLGVGWFLKMI